MEYDRKYVYALQYYIMYISMYIQRISTKKNFTFYLYFSEVLKKYALMSRKNVMFSMNLRRHIYNFHVRFVCFGEKVRAAE